MKFALITAMGCIGSENIPVSLFQFFQDIAFVDNSGTAVVSQRSEKNRILAILRIKGTKLAQVFPQQGIRLSLGELYTTAVRLTGKNTMTISDIRLIKSFG